MCPFGADNFVLQLYNFRNKNGRTKDMKKHKLFAWLTVAFFLLTIITGYEKK